MKKILLVLIGIPAFAFSQNNEVSFQLLQAKANSLNEEQIIQERGRFTAKFSGDEGNKEFLRSLVNSSKASENLTWKRHAHDLGSAIAGAVIDKTFGKGLTQTILKKFSEKKAKEFEDLIDPSKADERRKMLQRDNTIVEIVKRFNSESQDNVLSLKQKLESSEDGLKLKERLGNDVWDAALNKYNQNVIAGTLSKAAFEQRINEMEQKASRDKKEYIENMEGFVAEIMTAEEANRAALQRMESRYKKTTGSIKELTGKIEGLMSQGKNYEKELKQLNELMMYSLMDQQAIKSATRQNTEGIVRIGEEVAIIKAGVIVIEKDLKNLTKDVAEMKLKDEWKEMSLEAQIYALEKSNRYDRFFKNKAAKDSVVNDYKAVAFRQMIITGLNKGVAWGQVGLQAMETFKFGDTKTKKFLATAIEVGNIAANVASKNYPAAVMGAINLFNKSKGSDSQQEMLQAIMKRIEALHKDMMQGFNMVNRNLELIYNDMNTQFTGVFDYLDKIKEEIDVMRVENNRNFANILKKLDLIENQNNCTRDQINNIGSLYENCFNSYHSDSAYPAKNKRDYYTKFSEGHSECIANLSRQISGNLEDQQIFDNSDCDAAIKMNELYSDVLATWSNSLRRQNKLPSSELAYMYYAPLQFYETDQYYKKAFDLRDSLSSGNSFLIPSRFTNPVTVKLKNSVKVNTMSRYLLHFLPYLEMYYTTSTGGKWLDSTKAISREKIERLEAPIKSMIKISEIALVQNFLLNGNNLVNNIGEIIRTEDNDHLIKAVFDLIAANPYFERNLSLYLTTKYFPSLDSINKIIDWAKSNKNRYMLISDKEDWLAVYSDSESNLSFEIQTLRPILKDKSGDNDKKQRIVYKIDVAKEVYDLNLTEFVMDTETYNLIITRQLLLDKLSEYSFLNSIPESDNVKIDKRDLIYLLSEKE